MTRFLHSILATLAIVATLPAIAAPGFFRPAPIAHPEDPPAAAGVLEAGAQCGLVGLYDAATPGLLTLKYVGVGCLSTALTAIRAAAAAHPAVAADKAGFPQRPGLTPVYECTTTVLWDPASAASPDVATSGSASCGAVEPVVLAEAAGLVACFLNPAIACP